MAVLEYDDFIIGKKPATSFSGFEPDWTILYPGIFPFQEYVVNRAVKAGRFAIFADCGLGKTLMQLMWARQVYEHTGKPVIILAPLAVCGQTVKEAAKFGMRLHVDRWGVLQQKVVVANYEQLDNIDVSVYGGVVLDESSILKNFTGATRNALIEAFKFTPYKLCCTATPSPNDELELGNHAEFLGIMTSMDMRAIYFTTDKNIDNGSKYRLKKPAVKDFYRWVSTWAIMMSKPSDIGFSDEGYDLPPLNFIEHQIVTEKRDNGQLYNDTSVSATDFNKELRLTINQRMAKAAEIVNASSEQFIVWIKQDAEGELLRKLIPDAVEVKGSDSREWKESNLLGFADNKFRVLITKQKIAQFGLNYQNCHNQVFPSLDFSFEGLYQAIRRSYRFGQIFQVNIHLITTDTMQNVIASIEEKQRKFIQMQDEMREAINYSASLPPGFMHTASIQGDGFSMFQGDCVTEIKRLEDESVDYSFFSPPFGAMYVFSDDARDMSNVHSNDEFLKHFGYLPPELFRVLKPGRLVSLHIMQSTTLMGRDGFYSLVDFRGDVIRLFQQAGFYFHAENMIRKDPKMAAIRTKNHQLMHGSTKKDSSIVRPGLADYIITFRKPGENQVPIINDIPFDLWCQIAEPVWLDIDESDTLSVKAARGQEDERHITPTQLKPIEWCYLMWSNKGDTVLCPFAGVGSEGVVALGMDRKYIGIELKQSYYDMAVKNCRDASASKAQASLF